MDLNRLVTVVIPTLNEAEAIGPVLDELLEAGIRGENILVVDGGSTDGTVEIARERGVKVVFQEGRGKTAAIATALRHVPTPYVLVMDGDYTYPAKHVEPLLRRAVEEELDWVVGARRWGEGSQGLVFRLGNRILTGFFNLLFGTRLSDVLSGMYVVRTDRLRELFFESEGFGIESEIAAHITSMGGRIGEVPIKYRRRLGRKKLGVRHGFRIAWEMLRLAWHYNPVFIAFALCSLILIPGILLDLYVAYRYLAVGAKHYVKGIIGVTLTVAGAASLLLAILSLYMKRMELRLVRKLEELERRLKGRGGEQ